MTIKIPITYLYEKIKLQLLSQEDLIQTLSWRNHYKNWFNDNLEITLEKHLNWFNNYQKKDYDLVYIVVDDKNNKVGQTAVYNIDSEKKEAEFGRFLVNPDFSGQGLMTIALQSMLQLCRDYFLLKSLHLDVKSDNHVAIHIYKKAGFEIETESENENIFMRYYYE